MHDPLGNLLAQRRFYLELMRNWKIFCDFITQTQAANLPLIVVSHEPPRIEITWTDIKTFCHLTFDGEYGRLAFGYQEKVLGGGVNDIITQCQYVDKLGNVRDTPAASSRWSLKVPEGLREEAFKCFDFAQHSGLIARAKKLTAH